jgi:hypothetical protein
VSRVEERAAGRVLRLSIPSRIVHGCLRRASYRGAFAPALAPALRAVLPLTLEDAERRGIGGIIGWLLGEPRRQCRLILREFLFQRAVAAKRWADVMSKRIGVDRATETVILEDEDAIGGFLGSGARGVVVTGYHAGDYLSALLKLATLLPRGRCIHVLRRADGQRREANRVLPTLLRNVRVVLDDRRGLRAAVSALRHGDLLVVLCDLPKSWGPAAPVTLFGRPMAWTRSPVDFGTLGHADLLPLTTHLTARGICVATPHALMPAGSLSHGAPMQHLAGIAEGAIRAFPGQWHQWPLVPEMLRQPGAEAAPDG